MQKEQDATEYMYYKLSGGDPIKEIQLRLMGITDFFKFMEFGNKYNKELTDQK